MKISATGLAIVKAFESCLRPIGGGKYKAYVDPVGVLTIGYGHTNHHLPKFDSSTIWTFEQCESVLADDMNIFEKHVANLAKVELKQHEFDALVSWSFNTGGPATATLWRRLNAGDKKAVPAELMKWNKGGGRELPGLTRRRRSESLLFNGDIEGALRVAQVKAPIAKPIPAPVPPPDVPPIGHDPDPDANTRVPAQRTSIIEIIISIIKALFKKG